MKELDYIERAKYSKLFQKWAKQIEKAVEVEDGTKMKVKASAANVILFLEENGWSQVVEARRDLASELLEKFSDENYTKEQLIADLTELSTAKEEEIPDPDEDDGSDEVE